MELKKENKVFLSIVRETSTVQRDFLWQLQGLTGTNTDL